MKKAVCLLLSFLMVFGATQACFADNVYIDSPYVLTGSNYSKVYELLDSERGRAGFAVLCATEYFVYWADIAAVAIDSLEPENGIIVASIAKGSLMMAAIALTDGYANKSLVCWYSRDGFSYCFVTDYIKDIISWMNSFDEVDGYWVVPYIDYAVAFTIWGATLAESTT